MTHEEALKIAALEASTEFHYVVPSRVDAAIKAYLKAMGSEPVAWQVRMKGNQEWTVVSLPSGYSDRYELRPLFSSPIAHSTTNELRGVEAATDLPAYDAGLLNDFGGGDVSWWQDYIRGELARAHEFYQSHFTAYLEATTPVLAGAKVKPLEWVKVGFAFEAKTILGVYRADQCAEKARLYSLDRSSYEWFNSRDEAKAAAQADYEQRILSALVHPKAGDNAEVEPVAWRRPVSDIELTHGHPIGDHGTALQAINWVLNHGGPDARCEIEAFLKNWMEGNLDEWPEFYAWLAKEDE
jgi:hypothetical protein